MSAGHKIYSFDWKVWKVFTDLTLNPKSTRPARLAAALANSNTREELELPARLPKETDKLTSFVRKLFLQSEWFTGQPVDDVKLRNQLLFAMFFADELLRKKKVCYDLSPSQHRTQSAPHVARRRTSHLPRIGRILR